MRTNAFEDIAELLQAEVDNNCPTPVTGVPEPEMINFYKLYNRRVVYYVGDIDASLVEISKMIQIANIEDIGKPVEDRVPIKLLIFSGGGADQPTWNLVDIIKSSKTPVWTINAGMCMSNGLSLLVAGHKRFALEHSSAMYHSGFAGLAGTREQVSSAQKWLDEQNKIYEKWFFSRVNIDQKLFNRKKSTDWYFTAEEMLKYGIVDKIVDDVYELV